MPTVAGGNVWSLSSKALNIALAQPDPRGSSHLAIIVQTNFQVCAYTTSELHISMLGLFCDVQTIRRLPNVVFMVMTRNSVKSAFAFGIKARQILRFLEKHAHPKLRDPNNNIGGGANTGSPLPSNVVDQVWLWDRERTRVTFTEVAVHQCLMPGEFGAVLDYASRGDGGGGACPYSSERRQQIFVNYAYIEKIQNFVRKWRAEHAAAVAGR
jgi:transcription initiation factor TFIIH subunit 4